MPTPDAPLSTPEVKRAITSLSDNEARYSYMSMYKRNEESKLDRDGAHCHTCKFECLIHIKLKDNRSSRAGVEEVVLGVERGR